MDLPVLKYLDVLIGLTFVMILGCTVVAAVTQAITSSLYLRAQYLRQGLADMLQQLDPSASAADCQYAAQLVQRHPLVCRSATLFGQATAWLRRNYFANRAWLPSGAPAETVQRHEFVRILLEWASGQGVLANAVGRDLPDAQRERLNRLAENIRAILAQNGIRSAAEALDAIRDHSVAQERTNPHLPAHLWHTAALIDGCPSRFVGKVTGWYDSMATRTSQRFTLQSKLIGGLVSLGVVLAVPLDSIYLVKRLAVSDAERAQLVANAQALQAEKRQEAGNPNNTQARADFEIAEQNIKVLQDSALSLGNIYLTKLTFWHHFPGLLLSWVLLSLGTPFWYDALKNLLKLRSAIAQKDDRERADRLNASTALLPPPETVAGAAADTRTKGAAGG